MKNYNHALLIMEKHEYPAEAKEAIIRAEEKILANEKANEIHDSMFEKYWIQKKNFGEFAEESNALAELIDEPAYTIYLVLLLNCAEPLLDEYKKRGYPEEIYWTSVLDLKSKMLECKENYDIWGTFVEGWFRGFYILERFGIGRFQFDLSEFGEEFYEENGVFIKEDDFCLGLHIPSHREPLTYEIRMDTYKKAYEFFKDRFDGKPMVICCNSWLLYPDNLNILPEKSNTSDFILDFQPLDIRQTYDFGDGWRIFGVGKSSLKPEELPRNTSMQRAFAEWFDQGKKAGNAYCILIFDGEKIVTRCDRETYRQKYGY